MDTRSILSFNINEQLLLVIQNTHEVTQSLPAFAVTSCERDWTRQNGLIALVNSLEFEWLAKTSNFTIQYQTQKTPLLI